MPSRYLALAGKPGLLYLLNCNPAGLEGEHCHHMQLAYAKSVAITLLLVVDGDDDDAYPALQHRPGAHNDNGCLPGRLL